MSVLVIARFRPSERERWLDCAAAVLSPEERQHLVAIIDPDTRTGHAIGRAMMRMIGAQLSGRSPSRLGLALTLNGRPWFPELPELRTSVSHAGRAVVIAAQAKDAIGVDIESAEGLPTNPRRLVQRLFAPVEAESVREMSDAALADWFTGAWTVKEAVGKALGVGIFPALSGVVTDSRGGDLRLATVPAGPPAEVWTLHSFTAPGGSEKIAVAVSAPEVALGRVAELTLDRFCSAVGR